LSQSIIYFEFGVETKLFQWLTKLAGEVARKWGAEISEGEARHIAKLNGCASIPNITNSRYC